MLLSSKYIFKLLLNPKHFLIRFHLNKFGNISLHLKKATQFENVRQKYTDIYEAITYFQLVVLFFFPRLAFCLSFLFLSFFLLILPSLAVPSSFWEASSPQEDRAHQITNNFICFPGCSHYMNKTGPGRLIQPFWVTPVPKAPAEATWLKWNQLALNFGKLATLLLAVPCQN